MEYLVGLTLGIIGGVLVYELYVWLLPITNWLARGASWLLPRDDRDRFFEEWTADLETLPVSLVRLLRCLDLYRAAFGVRLEKVSWDLRKQTDMRLAAWTMTLDLKIREVFAPSWRSLDKRTNRLIARIERGPTSPGDLEELNHELDAVIEKARRLLLVHDRLDLFAQCKARFERLEQYPELQDAVSALRPKIESLEAQRKKTRRRWDDALAKWRKWREMNVSDRLRGGR